MKNPLPILPILLALLAFDAHAQTSEFVETIPSPYLRTDLTLSMGLGVASTLKYVGSSEREVLPLPILAMQWKSGVFFGTTSGFGYDFSADPTLQYGVRLGLEAYQAQSPSNQNEGPGNTMTDLEPGLFANYLADPHVTLMSALSSGAGTGTEHNGIEASFGVRTTAALTDQQRVFFTLGTTWASQHYMQSYYGVTAQQAAQSGFSGYSPSAGIKDIKADSSWHWNVDPHWSVVIGGSVSQPMNAAAHSPLVINQRKLIAYSATYYRF